MFTTSMICSRNIIYLRKTLINPTVQEFHRTTVRRPFSEDTWEVITFRTYRHATAICRCHRLKKRVLITMNKWVQIIGLIFFKRIRVTKDCNRHQLLPFPLPFVDREALSRTLGFRSYSLFHREDGIQIRSFGSGSRPARRSLRPPRRKPIFRRFLVGLGQITHPLSRGREAAGEPRGFVDRDR